MSHFEALLGPTLATKEGPTPTAEALAGKEVVGLYFSAHWCGPCRQFTPALAASYERIARNDAKPFEIVFVSSDRDEGAFGAYYGEQPWLALPYAARGTKASLSKAFRVQGVPTLVLLHGATGELLTADGREVLSDDPAGADFPWPKKSLLELLGGPDGQLLASPSAPSGGEDVAVASLWGTKKLGFYFSAHWCPPCKAFTPKLVDACRALRQAGEDGFEIVFVSSDHTPSQFARYFQSMPWLALPPGDRRGKGLSRHFGVDGIPAFAMVDERGELINANARAAVLADPAGARFPWRPEPAADVEEDVGGLSEAPSVLALLEGLEARAQAEAVAALKRAAAACIARSKAAGEAAPPFRFFYAARPSAVAAQLRALAQQPAQAEAGEATLLLLDIADEGAFYAAEGAQVGEAAVRALLDGYAAKTLTRRQMREAD